MFHSGGAAWATWGETPTVFHDAAYKTSRSTNQPSRQPTESPPSPTHARTNGRLDLYDMAQRVLKGDAAGDDGIVRRVSAAEIEAVVVNQIRSLLRQPEITAQSV